MISPAQCRVARGLLDWTPQELARRARLAYLQIQSFERGRENLGGKEIQAITLAFEAAGVQFIPEGGGAGVRFRNGKAD